MRSSVITPCRNAEGLVDATVRSVTSQHLAPGDTLHHLLVDGASSDRTVERALAAAAGSAVNPGGRRRRGRQRAGHRDVRRAR
jgi:glycosyltransferase involved in cell wall biosynthesis